MRRTKTAQRLAKLHVRERTQVDRPLATCDEQQKRARHVVVRFPRRVANVKESTEQRGKLLHAVNVARLVAYRSIERYVSRMVQKNLADVRQPSTRAARVGRGGRVSGQYERHRFSGSEANAAGNDARETQLHGKSREPLQLLYGRPPRRSS